MIFIQSTEKLAAFELTAGTLMLKAEADATRVAIIASFILLMSGYFFGLIDSYRIEDGALWALNGRQMLKADSADRRTHLMSTWTIPTLISTWKDRFKFLLDDADWKIFYLMVPKYLVYGIDVIKNTNNPLTCSALPQSFPIGHICKIYGVLN